MKTLAKVVIDALAFLELSGEDVVDSDAAVAAMESLAADLRQCSPEERAALTAAVRAEYESQKAAGASSRVLDFYSSFMENFIGDA